MTVPPAPVTIALRIPGQWTHTRELVQRLPTGCRLTGEALILPDGTQVDFGAMAADDQFAQIFQSACRQEPAPEVRAIVAGTGLTWLGPRMAHR